MKTKLQFARLLASTFRFGAVAFFSAVALILSACTSSTFPTPVVVKDAPTACAALNGKTIASSLIGEPTTGATVTSATFNTAVADAPNAGGTATVQGTPDYCKVLVVINPVDPTAPVINVQVNLPSSWNGKKLQFGGGGFNGSLITGVQQSRTATLDVPLPLTQSYMTAGTDSGHQSPTGVSAGAFALNDEALVNYAYAAYKKTHDVAIQLSQLYYKHKPMRSYYMGGSEGGREGMMMAQRYPDDFDGIVAIDPVMNSNGLWTFQNSFGGIQKTADTWLGTKGQLIHNTVETACDSLDGIVDHVVSNYMACTPIASAALEAIRCPSGADEGPTCVSDGQLTAIRWMYNGYTFPFSLANGITSYSGYLYGSEMVPNNLTRWVTGTVMPSTDPEAAGASGSYLYGSYYVRYFVAKDPSLNTLTYNPASYQARVQELSNMLDATNPDLSAFYRRGGKLILREDLSDKGQSPMTGLNYRDAVVAKMGKNKVDQFFVAYVATGLPHTSPGLEAGTVNAPSYGTPGHFDFLPVLENWVENGVAPADQYTLTNAQTLPPYSVIASKPMCKQGMWPKFVGNGSTGGDKAINYVCVSN